MGKEPVEQRAEVVDRAQMNLEEEAVLAGDAMTLPDFGDLHSELGNPRQLPGGRLDPDDCGELVAERARIDLGPVAGDDARPLQPLHAFGHCGRREADPPPEFCKRDATVGRKLADDLTVSSVQSPKIGASGSRSAVLHGDQRQ